MTPPYVDDGLPDVEYHADRTALSSSAARLLLPPLCPAKFRWAMDHPREEKRHYDLGHVFHSVLLGVGAPVVRVQADNWNKKADQKIRDDAYAAGHVPILEAEYQTVLDMVDAVRKHTDAAALLDPDSGRAEVSIFWDDAETGWRRKARVDFLPHPEPGEVLQVVDVKSAHSVEPGQLAKVMDLHGQYIQAAWYSDAVEAAGLTGGAGVQFLFVNVEKDPPHLITIASPNAVALEWGRVEARKALDRWAWCTETGEWPGYDGDRIHELALPVWRIRQLEDGMNRGLYDTRRDAL